MKIKISGGAERDIERGCDFYRSIDLDLAMYFNDCISADIDSLRSTLAFMQGLTVCTTRFRSVSRS
ncbi:MAG: hypothetical protein KDB27_06020 [Planctomycetales bacterium]|nr:hypothetical protein [Planctomycetales bacterium]